jgi:excisionase family DNA binding protein
MEQEVIYSPNQIAEHLGVTPATVRKYINSGKLPAYHVGRNLRVSDSDYKKFIGA